MELQKAVGALTQAVTTLTNEVAEQGRKLDRISHRVYAAGVVLAVAAPIIIFLANLLTPVILSALRKSPN